jgi:hypothetical protein
MSDQQEAREESARLSKGWAMATFIGLMAVALMASFFVAQDRLYGRLNEAQLISSRQRHCIAIRQACHNLERVPQLCDLRQRRDLPERQFGPDGVPCPGAPPLQEGLCSLVETVPTVDCYAEGSNQVDQEDEGQSSE